MVDRYPLITLNLIITIGAVTIRIGLKMSEVYAMELTKLVQYWSENSYSLIYRHGMPINEELAKAVQNRSILQNGSIIPPSSVHTSTDSPHRKQQGQRLNTQDTDAGTSNESSKDSVDIDERLERLTVKETEGQRADVKVQGGPAQEAVEIDSYYVSHGSSNNATGKFI